MTLHIERFAVQKLVSQMRVYFSLFFLLALAACSSVEQKYESVQLYKLKSPLTSGGWVSIQIPNDGRFEDTIYIESGKKTALAFKSAFEAHTESVELLDQCPMNDCLSDKKIAGYKYYVVLNLIYWEDRSTNWSNKADRLTLEISIYDVSSDSLVTSSYLHTNTSMGAPRGGHVEDFLPSLAKQYVSSLYY